MRAGHGRFRESDAFRHVFETVVSRCIEEGLVGGEGFAVDATLIAADANKQRSIPGSQALDWSALGATRRSVQEYLDTLDKPHGARPARSNLSSSLAPIPLRNGRSMSKQRAPFGKPKSARLKP